MSQAFERRRVLVVVAHPDDAEFSCGGTVARWTAEGVEAGFLIVSNGNKGSADRSLSPARLSQIRQEEQRRAARVLGVRAVEFLDHEDGYLQPTLELRREITAHLRRFRPDTVITHDPTRRWFGRGYINHPDHIAVGEATLAAIFPSARDHLTFPDLLAEGLEPHRVSEVLLPDREEPDVYVDVSPTFELKLQALECHVSQGLAPALEWLRERSQEAALAVVARGTPPLDGSGGSAAPELVEVFKRFLLD